MNKYIIILIVVLSLMFFSVSAFATEQVIPTPPSWVEESEYVVFENSRAYEPEMWKQICEIRADLEKTPDYSPNEYNGLMIRIQKVSPGYEKDAGHNFEVGLLYYKFFLNYGARLEAGSAKTYFTAAGDISELGDKQKMSYMWAVRASLLQTSGTNKVVPKLMAYQDYDIYEAAVNKDVLNWSSEYLKNVLATPVLLLDGSNFDTGEVYPEITNGRVMLPIRKIVEAIGGTVEWNDKAKEVTITRAGDTLILTVGNSTAYKNKKSITLDVAPYIKDGSTFLPVRFVSEQLGQKVTWAQNPRIVSITENKDTYENSNLEMWVKAMGGYSTEYPKCRMFCKTRYVNIFAGYAVREKDNVELVKNMLKDSWSVMDRDGLLYQIEALTENGHNSDFIYEVDLINSLTNKEYEQLLKNADDLGEYMVPFVKELGEKWGERGILAWDLFRVSSLAQWGYTAGYLTYDEAVAAVKPAAIKLQKNFSSWEEAYDNYVDGHVWWSCTDVRGLDYEEWGRRAECKEMMLNYKDVFDNSLFKEKIY
jgi:hypothetical protein